MTTQALIFVSLHRLRSIGAAVPWFPSTCNVHTPSTTVGICRSAPVGAPNPRPQHRVRTNGKVRNSTDALRGEKVLVRQEGFEPSTLALKGRYSTAELLAHTTTVIMALGMRNGPKYNTTPLQIEHQRELRISHSSSRTCELSHRNPCTAIAVGFSLRPRRVSRPRFHTPSIRAGD